MICFLDIDEVLVDFLSAALREHEVLPEEVFPIWPKGVWGVHEVLGMSQNQFWKPIDAAGAEFWENLEEKPWIDEMLYLTSLKFDDCYLVSAPSLCPTSYTGKVNWIRNRFGRGFDKFILTPHKELLAGPDRILIDDRPKNVEKFRERGGRAILFPFWGNENRIFLVENPVEYVTDQIDRMSDSNPYLSNHLRRCNQF